MEEEARAGREGRSTPATVETRKLRAPFFRLREEAERLAIVGHAVESGEAVAAEREQLRLVHGYGRPRAGDESGDPEESPILLPEPLRHLSADALRALRTRHGPALLSRSREELGHHGGRAHEQGARVQALHAGRALVEVDDALVGVDRAHVAPVGGEGGRHQALVPLLAPDVVECFVEAVEEPAALHLPDEPLAPAGEREDLAGGVDRARLLVAGGGVLVRGQDGPVRAVDLRRPGSVRPEGLGLAGGDPVPEPTVRRAGARGAPRASS